MSSILTKIADFNNLYWAWEKAKNTYRPGDIWFNELEVAAFEANIAEELACISRDILSGNFNLGYISPVPFPKGKNGDGPRTRQTFWISVRDQVAWLAIVNIIGGLADAKMPFWSYGNRLYLSIFFQNNEEGKAEPRYGYYRNTTKNLFRKWTQSWPLYRRHINITARLLSKTKASVSKDLEVEEVNLIANNDNLENNHPLKNSYIQTDYWTRGKKGELYWAGIDLEKFYQSINVDLILSNFKTYLPAEHFSEELYKLLGRMLDFKIDYGDWPEADLRQINLETKQEAYPHLPTGLFVAGFLANVAMLKIDESVGEKLMENKNIAHFRYVDDHVILSNNFDALVDWIESYNLIILESGLGSVFNQNKTEPEALGNYFKEYQELEDEGRVKAKENARNESSLDPDFPSPLMTQTLGKVSRIAGTEFSLLTPDEEKNMIADVEHLLVTEFPDHELRRDTRVSFAARMLSNMVPRIQADNNNLYQLNKEILVKKTALRHFDKQLGSLKRGVGRSGMDQSVRLLKQELKSCEENYKLEKIRLAKEEDKLSQRTIKLLSKAVIENHDKIRLWSRLMEFFQKSGASSPELVLKEFQKLIDKGESNLLSASFLKSLVLQVLSTLLFESIKVVTSVNYSIRRRERAFSFIRFVLRTSFLNNLRKDFASDKKNFEGISLQLFQFTCGTIIHFLNEYQSEILVDHRFDVKQIDGYGLIDWNKPLDFTSKSNYGFGVWCWWLLSHLPTRSKDKSPYMWKAIVQHLDLNNQTDLNVLLLFPKKIPSFQLKMMNMGGSDVLKNNEGVLFDILKGAADSSEEKYDFLKRVEKKSKPFKAHISIADWVTWTFERQRNLCVGHEVLHFDPRLGEWTALEIIRQVAQILKESLEISPFDDNFKAIEYFKFIHPNNFKLPLEWINNVNLMTWESLREMLSGGKVEFRATEDLIMDNRYVPYFGSDKENENQSMLIALGSLLISLLAKDLDLPNKWNPLGQQQAWMGLAKIKLKDVAISTFTRDILSGCFSNRNIETRFNKRLGFTFDFSFDDDTTRDPPEFGDLDDFLKHVNLALQKLKTQQLSVSNHQPRQLTPISLIKLKQENYEELLNELNIES
jgi:hypothetical protein